MKYLFCTLTFTIDVTIPDLIYWFLEEKKVTNCSVFAAGRLGIKVAEIKNSEFYFSFKGYKLGSISYKDKRNNIKYSFLIFSNKKVKLSMGFPKTEFDFDKYIKDTLDYYSSIFHCTISNIEFHNITTQKHILQYSFNDIKTYLQNNNHLFHKIIYPDFLLHTHPFIRCYVDKSSLHCSFDTHGTSQILGAKSNNDIIKMKSIIDKIDLELFFDTLLK